MNNLLTVLDNGQICILTLIDLSAAFNSIDHNIPFHQLEHIFGIRDSALSWFRPYLSDRTEIVMVNGLRSDKALLCFHVSLGSILRPAVFVLCTQLQFALIKKHLIQPTITSYKKKKTAPDQIQPTTGIMQNCITDVKSWMTHNKLQSNDSKTESMIVKS